MYIYVYILHMYYKKKLKCTRFSAQMGWGLEIYVYIYICIYICVSLYTHMLISRGWFRLYIIKNSYIYGFSFLFPASFCADGAWREHNSVRWCIYWNLKTPECDSSDIYRICTVAFNTSFESHYFIWVALLRSSRIHDFVRVALLRSSRVSSLESKWYIPLKLKPPECDSSNIHRICTSLDSHSLLGSSRITSLESRPPSRITSLDSHALLGSSRTPSLESSHFARVEVMYTLQIQTSCVRVAFLRASYCARVEVKYRAK